MPVAIAKDGTQHKFKIEKIREYHIKIYIS